ncbi:MFS transporter [Gluconacetobacter sp. Hr-1-5]|uniref:MFS transporter n=1 Tax=Gluconacetobacter sp. Hr-1-5 TaxID=3395370 RepID=UPI003B5268C4
MTWSTIALCGSVICAEGYDMGIMGGVLLVFRRTPAFAADATTLGAVSSAALVGMFMGSPLGGRLAQHLGRKPVLIGAFALFCVATLACAWVATLPALALWRAIAGLGMGAALPCAAALTTEHSPPRHASRNYAIMYSGYSIGMLSAALIAIPFVRSGNWHTLFLIGGTPCVLLPVLVAFLPESPAFLRTRQVASRRVFSPAANGGLHSRRALRAGCSFSATLLIGLFLIYGLGTWLPTLLAMQGRGIGSSLRFLAMFSLSSAFGGVACGWLADRFGTRRILFLSFLSGALATVFLRHPMSPGLTLAAVCVAGYASVASSLVLTGYAASWFPPHSRAAAIGPILGIARLGAIGGPFIAGAILQLTSGNIARVVECFAALFTLSACLCLFIPQQQQDLTKRPS